jgi:ABC-type transport system substrate-binding protein
MVRLTLACGIACLLSLSGVWQSVMVGWAAAPADTPKSGGKLVFAEGQDVYSIAPYVYGGTAVLDTTYNSLFRPNDRGLIEPDLAESYTTPDPTTYVVKIRKDVRFHDGQPLTAEDVKFSFEYMMRPSTAATRGALLTSLIDRIDVLDPFTIRLKLKAPAATFLSVLALPEVPIISKAWVDAGGDYRKAFNGTGPFRVVSFVRGEKYVLRRNDHYFRKGLPYLDEIEVRVVLDDATRVQAVKAGDADILDFMPWADGVTSGLNIEKGWSIFNGMVFNPNKAPWNDKRVRQAVAYSIDRKTVNAIAHGGLGLPITGGLFHSGSRWHCPELDNTYTYNPTKAKALLAQAGYPNGVTMNLILPQFGPYSDAWAVVGDNLRSGGINVKVTSTDLGGAAEVRANGKYEVLFTGTTLIYDDPDALSVFYQSSGAFFGHAHNFKDAKVDEWFKRGLAMSSFEERKKVYCELQAYGLDQAWWVFITWRPNIYAMKSSVKGFTPLPGFYQFHSQRTLERSWLSR